MLFSELAEEHRAKAVKHEKLSDLDDLAESLTVLLEGTDDG